ncbi:hypothetical protein EV363DRAFT_1341888 [Boletus edulis]|nr:hypothetical protein EV363DRAFT_1341888 [Boletus edulis]
MVHLLLLLLLDLRGRTTHVWNAPLRPGGFVLAGRSINSRSPCNRSLSGVNRPATYEIVIKPKYNWHVACQSVL